MVGTLRFLIAAQGLAIALCILFGFLIARARTVEPHDVDLFRQQVAAAETPAEWDALGNLLVDIIVNRGSAYDSLRTKVLGFFSALAVDMLCSVIVLVQLLRGLKSAGHEEPGVVFRRF
jgi:hypothetical protein